MKTQLFKSQQSTSQWATLEELVQNWVLATKQFSYWHHELMKAIQNNHSTNQPLVTATFYSTSRCTKTELIALEHDLCAQLSSLLIKPGATQPDKSALAFSNQLREDTHRILAWCQQIQTALGLDSIEGA